MTNCIKLAVTSGKNTITRKSSESSVTVPDRMSFPELMKKADEAVDSGSKLDLHMYTRSCGIPERMLLPRGNPQGMEFDLYVAVTDGEEDLVMKDMEKDERGSTHTQCGVHGEKYPDKRPLGYPFDRRIPDDRVFENIPNFYHKTIEIFHQKHE